MGSSSSFIKLKLTLEKYVGVLITVNALYGGIYRFTNRKLLPQKYEGVKHPF